MLLAVWLMVLLVFFLLQDSARVVSFCTALFAPAFAYMGVTFPTHEMPLLARLWRELMPSSHYIESHISVISYGDSWQMVLRQSESYWGFLVLIPVIVILAKWARKRQAEAIEVERHS